MGDNHRVMATRSDHDRDPARLGLRRDQTGATTLEWTLLLAAIAVPSYFIFKLALAALIGHYQLVTTITALPFPCPPPLAASRNPPTTRRPRTPPTRHPRERSR